MYFAISYKRNLLTAVYGSLIPLIIGANLLKIASQILFLTLFVSDLTFGMVQIPSKIYLLWESSEPTCFEVQLSAFSMPFPMCMSFNLLCPISIERYIYIVHNRFYKRTVTKKLLAIVIISLIFHMGHDRRSFASKARYSKISKNLHHFISLFWNSTSNWCCF